MTYDERAQVLWDSLKSDEDPIPAIAAAIKQGEARGLREAAAKALACVTERKSQHDQMPFHLLSNKDQVYCKMTEAQRIADWCLAQAKERER